MSIKHLYLSYLQSHENLLQILRQGRLQIIDTDFVRGLSFS